MTYVILLVRAYTHGWLGHNTPTASQHNIFDSGGGKKNPYFFLHVLLAGIRTSGPLDLESDALYQLSTPTPSNLNISRVQLLGTPPQAVARACCSCPQPALPRPVSASLTCSAHDRAIYTPFAHSAFLYSAADVFAATGG